jgi:serine/threonine-protein kinase
MREDIERALRGVPVQATPLLHDQTVSIAPIVEEEYIRRQPRGRRTLTYIMVILIAIGMFILIGVIARHLLTTKHQAVTVPVPNVSGFSQADATATLKNAGLNPVALPGASATVAKGIVISENPPQGTPLPLKTNVTIYVSTGPQAVQVPDLTNQSLADAKSELLRNKLILGTTTTQDSPQSANTVLSQTPAAGANVTSGSAVNIVVASGKSTVPDVRNLPVAEAEQALTAAGFNFQEISQPSSTLSPGIIINQSPAHDSPAKTGTIVKLFVSVTPPPSSSPPVISPPPSSSPTATPTGSPSA